MIPTHDQIAILRMEVARLGWKWREVARRAKVDASILSAGLHGRRQVALSLYWPRVWAAVFPGVPLPPGAATVVARPGRKAAP